MKEKYGRIVGGIAWPYGDRPGYLVVIGVDREIDKELKAHHMHLLDEAEADTISDLIDVSLELQDRYEVQCWDTGAFEPGIVELVHNRRDRVPALVPVELPEENLKLSHYYETILKVEKKRLLHLEANSRRLVSYLRALPPDCTHRRVAEYPPLAALGYAVREIYNWSQIEYETNHKSHAEWIIDHAENGSIRGEEYVPWGERHEYLGGKYDDLW